MGKIYHKTLVDNNTFRKIGESPSPWPCFVIVARENFIKNDNVALQTILDIINTTAKEFKEVPSIDLTLANRYKQKLEDVQEWLNLTEWSQELLTKETVNNVQKKLFALDIIPEICDYNKLVYL